VLFSCKCFHIARRGESDSHSKYLVFSSLQIAFAGTEIAPESSEGCAGAWPQPEHPEGPGLMPLRKLCLVVLITVPAMCWASVNAPSPWMERNRSLTARERQLWTPAVHDSEFATMQHTNPRGSCEATQPPEALATPNPLLEQPDASSRIRVSFIIGTDGRVHSPLILESAGSVEDRTVLDIVRSWRYRPAMCNGVPTEAEAKVEFSNR